MTSGPAQTGPGGGGAATDRAGTRRRRWIVDGNNVMGARPDGWWRDRRAAARRLARQVAALDLPPDLDLVVVFDGPGPPGDEQVGVVYAGGGQSADDAIVAMLRSRPARNTTVFTSDAELGRRVRAEGGEVSGARRILGLIESGSGRSVAEPTH